MPNNIIAGHALAPGQTVKDHILVRGTELNQIRKFARYYPKPTESSF